MTVITYWLGQLALTFHVEWTTDGATMFTVTVQLFEPVTATLRLYQPFPDEPAEQGRGAAVVAAPAAGGGHGAAGLL